MIEKHSPARSFIEKLLILYIIINPLIDFFTGLYIKEVLGATSQKLNFQALRASISALRCSPCSVCTF